MSSRVTLLPSGLELAVETYESILDASLRAGLNLPHSCKGGHCSSCRARIITGNVYYPLGRPLGLAEHEEQAGYALLCQARVTAGAPVTVEVNEARPPSSDIEVRNLPCRIERTTLLAPDVMAVFLRIPAAEDFRFAAGQYLDVMLSQGRRRSFSIANAPHESGLIELHVRRVPGGEFTERLFDSTSSRQLRIEGPLGQFWFRPESSRPALLIGGGTGYAPLRAMLRERFAMGDQRAFHLYWGGRTLPDLYEHDSVLAWCVRHSNLRYTPVLSEPGSTPDWQGRRGWVHAAVLADHQDLRAFDVYASGPPAMVEAVRHEFVERGLPREQLHFDSFDYAPV